MIIPYPCDTCIHFSGMSFIPYCKKKVVGNANNKPVYEWCSIMRSLDGECGVDSKLYEKTDNVIRISPTVVYSGKKHFDKTDNCEDNAKINLNKISKQNRDNGKQPQIQKETVKACEKNESSLPSLESKRKRTKQSVRSSKSMEQLAIVLAGAS